MTLRCACSARRLTRTPLSTVSPLHPLQFFFSFFTQEGVTPLHAAARHSESEAIQVLVAAGANLEAANKVRCTLSLQIDVLFDATVIQ